MSADFTAQVRRIILARAEQCCEGCGKVTRLELHHRKYKSRGGLGTPGNGIALCGMGNFDGCHGKAHTAKGEVSGWSVESGLNPLEIPAQRFIAGALQWTLYDDDGGWLVIDEREALFRMHKGGA